MPETYMMIEQDGRGGYVVTPSYLNISVREQGESASLWKEIGHNIDVVFQRGYLVPELWRECHLCGHDHADAVRRFMEHYMTTMDGAGIVRKSDLDRKMYEDKGLDGRTPQMIAMFRAGEIDETQLLRFINGQATEAELKGEEAEAVLGPVVGSAPKVKVDSRRRVVKTVLDEEFQ